MRLTVTALLAALLAPFATADLKIGGWARATPPGVSTAAVYLAFANGADHSRTLASVHADGADRAMIHGTDVAGGVARMTHLATLEIPALGRVRLEPGGRHVMLTGLHQPLVAGERVTLRLTFADGQTMEVVVPVMPLTFVPDAS